MSIATLWKAGLGQSFGWNAIANFFRSLWDIGKMLRIKEIVFVLANRGCRTFKPIRIVNEVVTKAEANRRGLIMSKLSQEVVHVAPW